jgi:hypothetical protein
VDDIVFTIGPTCPPSVAARMLEISSRMATRERAWVAGLRARGVKAAHPDDGWVDRDRNTLQPTYATFDDGLQAGDLLALGWPWRARIVRVIRVEVDDRGVFVACPRTLWHFTRPEEHE